MQNPTSKQSREFYRILKEHLKQITGGEEVVRRFERDPPTGSASLAEFLRQHVPNEQGLANQLASALAAQSRSQFITEVSGGHVDQIVNIARLGALNLTIRRQFFLFRDIKQLAVVLTVIIAISVIGGYIYWEKQQPRVMDGAFNIAVAEIGEVTEGGVRPSAIAAKLSNSLFQYLDSEFNNVDFGLDVQIDHSNIPLITEKDQAEQLANQINADVVIYGTMVIDEGTAELDPSFWVSERLDADELTGQSRLGRPIEFDASRLLYTDEINMVFRSRAAALLAVTKGLVYLNARKADYALREFSNAAETMNELQQCVPSTNTTETAGCEVVRLLLGITQSRRQDYDAAESEFNASLALNPEYARAYNGLGNLYYNQAIRDNYNVKDLDIALAYYEQALHAIDAPARSFSREKAKLNLGNVYVVRAQQASDETLYARATGYYQEVINEYNAVDNDETRKRMRELASAAYFGLGAAYERRFMFDEAIAAYRQCMELTESEELKFRVQTQIEGIEAAVG